jgi:AraC-like DNA-binding protein
MELRLPYIDPFGFARSLVKEYDFHVQEVCNALNVSMPGKMGEGSLQLFIRNDIHYFRGKWKFNEQTIFCSDDPVGKNGLIDFRINATGNVQSTMLEGGKKFEHDTTTVDGMRIFIPERYLPADKKNLTSKFEYYRLDANINSLLNELFGIDYTEPGNSIFLEGKMLEFIYLWLGYLKKADISKYFIDISDYKLHCIKTAKSLIEENIATDISLKELSRKVGTNECDLKRCFRRMYGLSIHQHVIKTRLEKAHELITQTDLSIQEICNKIGYTNRGHFSQLYRKFYGNSPLSARLNYYLKKPENTLSYSI